MQTKFGKFHMPFAIAFAAIAVILLLFFCFQSWQEANELGKQKPHAHVQTHTADRRVLFISSYHDTFDTVVPQRQGLQEVFRDNDVIMDIAYMDTKNFDTGENRQLFYETLRYKMEHHLPYDAVVLGDDAALTFAEEHQQDLFAGLPMVFMCINDRDHAELAAENPFITGALEKYYMDDTLALALQMWKGTEHVVVIYDETSTGLGDYADFRKLVPKYPKLDFIFLNTSSMTRGELRERLHEITTDSIIFYLEAFADSEGRRYSIPESTELIVQNVQVPVFRQSLGGIGEGVLGGKIVDYRESGRVAAQTVVDVLDGRPIAEIPLERDGRAEYVFDYAVMKKFGISEALLPEGTELLNPDTSFWQENRVVLIPMMGIVAVLLVLLLLIYRGYRKMFHLSDKLKDMVELLDYQSTHDALTNLPNRQSAEAEIDRRLGRHVDFTALLVDLDNFKKINDFYSHLIGNEIMMELAKRIRERFLRKYPGSYAARIGGDEFILLLPGILREDDMPKLNQVLDIFHMPVDYEDKAIPVAASIGIIHSNDEQVNSADLMFGNADIALVDAKRLGKSRYVFYQSESKRSQQRANEIEELLRGAIEREEFRILYQPQVNAATKKLHGFEALIRMPEEIKIYPSEFIPVAENSGLIIEIGRIVTKKVIQQLAHWRSAGHKLYQVAINYSCGQLSDTHYAEYLAELMKEYDIPSEFIEIEVTESLFIGNNKQAHELFLSLAANGIKMALDDFGTGYSSLSYLTYLPVDVVKIDKSLMDTYLQDEMGEFMQNLVKLIHSLNMTIVVEGVEHMVQFEKLRDYHVDIIQGYYFSRPIPPEEAIRFDPGAVTGK